MSALTRTPQVIFPSSIGDDGVGIRDIGAGSLVVSFAITDKYNVYSWGIRDMCTLRDFVRHLILSDPRNYPF
jgi:hypothetical protein